MSTTPVVPEQVANDRTTAAEIAAHGIPSDFEEMYHQRGEEIARLEAVLSATRRNATPIAHPQATLKPGITAERFKAMTGKVEFLNLTRDQKLAGMGLDPKAISDSQLRQTFGKGADAALGADLMKVSPLRYRQLKEAALVLNIYGA